MRSEVNVEVVYDVCHNIARVEGHGSMESTVTVLYTEREPQGPLGGTVQRLGADSLELGNLSLIPGTWGLHPMLWPDQKKG